MGEKKYFPEFDASVEQIIMGVPGWNSYTPGYKILFHSYVRFERDECWWEVEIEEGMRTPVNTIISNMQFLQRFLLRCRMIQLHYIAPTDGNNTKHCKVCKNQQSEKNRIKPLSYED